MATIFTLFPDLPNELRRKIWAAVINHPRLIHPQQAPLDPPSPRTRALWLDDPLREPLSPPPKPYYYSSPPILLRVCRESRHEALLRYHHVSLPGGSSLGPPLYLNPLVDILYLSHASSTPPHHGVLGEHFSLFKRYPQAPGERASTPWDDLRAIGLCSSGAYGLIEALCLRFPALERVFLVQTRDNMADAHLYKSRLEQHLDRRREARGDGGIQEGLVFTLITWENLRAGGEWDGELETKGEGSVMQCQTCFVEDIMPPRAFGYRRTPVYDISTGVLHIRDIAQASSTT